MGPNFHGMGWDGISHGTNSYGMGLENFLRDGMGPNLRGMGYPVPYLGMGRDRDGTKPPWDGTSRPGPTASLYSHGILDLSLSCFNILSINVS